MTQSSIKDKKEKFISLKEAAALSGYTPDYIGQLIRQGKLPGKQVISNVAWMTTESAIKEYLEDSKKGKKREESTLKSFKERFLFEIEAAKLYKTFLYFVIAFSVLFSLFLFFVFSSSVDHYLSNKAIEKALMQGTR